MHKVLAIVVVVSFELSGCAILSSETPLHKAAEGGDVEQVNKLISQGANVNAKTKDLETPLDLAAENGHKTVAKLLLDKGARFNDFSARGMTPLHYAAYEGHRDVVELLLDSGADVNDRSRTCHWVPYGMGYRPVICPSFIYGDTPLHLAALGGHKDVAELLLARGADVNKTGYSPYGETPLHYAALKGHTDVAELLLNKGAVVNAQAIGPRGHREMPLHLAVREGHKDMVELLIARGAQVNAITDNGLTPLDLAKSMNSGFEARSITVQFLIDHGGKSGKD